MRSTHSLQKLAVLAALTITGCATVDPQPDYDQARQEIQAATGEKEIHDPGAPLLSREEIRSLVADGLGAAEATRIALLNNRRLQAGFLTLGVARADYVQAGLLQNPTLSLALLFPEGGGRVRWSADLLASVVEIWQIPARQALAQAGIEERILELSRFAGELVAATREAYFESVAARASHAVARTDADLTRRTLAGIRRQVEEGVASRIDEGLAESLALAAELAYQRVHREEIAALRRLAALLSVDDDLLTLTLTDPLPEPTLRTVERERLVEKTLTVRADIRAADRAIAAAEARVALERRQRFGLDVGASAERPEGGSSTDLLVGPAIALEIPIFDQNQAQISRAEYELAEQRKEREALLSEISQNVRAALDKAELAARVATLVRTEIVPQAEEFASLAETSYQLGGTTVLTLIQAQRTALEARRSEIDAVLEAALSQIDLERTVGAPLEEPGKSAAQP